MQIIVFFYLFYFPIVHLHVLLYYILYKFCHCKNLKKLRLPDYIQSVCHLAGQTLVKNKALV